MCDIGCIVSVQHRYAVVFSLIYLQLPKDGVARSICGNGRSRAVNAKNGGPCGGWGGRKSSVRPWKLLENALLRMVIHVPVPECRSVEVVVGRIMSSLNLLYRLVR